MTKSTLSGLVETVDRPATPIPMDPVDLAVLGELARDSRQSQRAISRAVGMSAPAVAERIARLERNGVIKSYTVNVDWDRLGHDVVVFMPIILESGNELSATIDAFRAIPQLEDLTVVAGQWDMIARFRLQDHRRLRELLLDRVWQIPNIRRFETILALGVITDSDYTERMLATLRDEPAP